MIKKFASFDADMDNNSINYRFILIIIMSVSNVKN
jgi:hypothetical protein